METYLKRTYKQRVAKARRAQEETESYPFWDYRSRRGSVSASTSGTSSSGSSSFDGCSLSSLSSIRSAEATDVGSADSSCASSESDVVMVTSDPRRLQLHFLVHQHEVLPLAELYRPVVDWVDADLHIFKVSSPTHDDDNVNQSFNQPQRVARMPSIAVMLFLSEEGPLGYERIQSAKRRFEKPPWRFHHSEQVGQGKINLYPYNSTDYFYTSEELPLWALRMVHCGKEFLRIVLFTSEESWNDMIAFYKLIIGFEPDTSKDDFCLFTVYSRGHYDVQLALKKLKGDTSPRPLNSVKLQFRVPDVGSLVPLFPNVCKPVSDNVWETKDHDGNVITIDVTGKPRPTSSTPTDSRNVTSHSRSSSRSSRSSRTSNGSTNSEHSDNKSVQSLTSVTSSSISSSMTSVSSDRSTSSFAMSVTSRDSEDVPPKLPPRVPLRKAPPRPPKLLPKPKECLASLQGFYV
ncbi:F124A-like protein [Mya arenaria]|uniref:F124A-like protein n=2 Tax=Mya arenaria TaxID=6604 RepID=A0ABY7G5J9_MYAAR|nr:protein FAM124A-like isoform X1 [Mya arenaria]XP_052782816.1 protein FAM124A-like isoform X1 [Mya arenaria]WAR28326.1 F124A-like protein [Mya arenaria]